MIEPASPVVPGHQNDRVIPIRFPIRALGIRADRINNRRYPRWPRAIRQPRVVRLQSIRNDPTHLRQLAFADVGKNVRRRQIHIAVGLAFVPVRSGTRAVENGASLLVRVRRRLQRLGPGGVIRPSNLRLGRGKHVRQSRFVQAGKNRSLFILRRRIHQLHQRPSAGRATVVSHRAFVVFGDEPIGFGP